MLFQWRFARDSSEKKVDVRFFYFFHFYSSSGNKKLITTEKKNNVILNDMAKNRKNMHPEIIIFVEHVNFRMHIGIKTPKLGFFTCEFFEWIQ